MKGYRTICQPGEVEHIIKKSRFIGAAYPVQTVEEALSLLETIRKRYWDATHNCYAYIIGENGEQKRFSDDGEPQGTAGMPMLDVLQKKDVTNLLVVVTRYFGGTLLGAGGLVRAYAGAAGAAVDAAGVTVMTPAQRMQCICAYPLWGRVEHWLGLQNVLVQTTDFAADVRCTVLVQTPDAQDFCAQLRNLCDGKVEICPLGEEQVAWPLANQA